MITLLIIGFIALASIAGMFYWMHKARNGTLNLEATAWHRRLMTFMWEVKTSDLKNACPYYWSIVCSLLILIPYLFIRYCLYMPYKHWPSWLTFSWPESKVKHKPYKFKKCKKPRFVTEFNIWDYLPTTLRGVYQLLYRKGKTILGVLFTILWIGLVALGAVVFLIYPFVKLSFVWALVFEGTVLYALITLLVCMVKPDWNQYHWDHWKNLGLSLYGIVMIPFRVMWGLVSTLFSFLFDVISDNCPPINWS